MTTGGTIGVQNTAPDIDPDEFLSSLDTDTRSYLQLLINGAGKGLAVAAPTCATSSSGSGRLHQDLARVSRRRSPSAATNLARLVHNYGQLTASSPTRTSRSRTLVDAVERRAPERSPTRTRTSRRPSRSCRARSTRRPSTLRQGEHARRARWARAFDSLRPAVPQARHRQPPGAAVRARRRRRSLRTRSGRSSRTARPYVSKSLEPGVDQPRARGAGPDHRVPRAQPLLQHRRLQPGRRREDQRRLRDQRRVLASPS